MFFRYSDCQRHLLEKLGREYLAPDLFLPRPILAVYYESDRRPEEISMLVIFPQGFINWRDPKQFNCTQEWVDDRFRLTSPNMGQSLVVYNVDDDVVEQAHDGDWEALRDYKKAAEKRVNGKPEKCMIIYKNEGSEHRVTVERLTGLLKLAEDGGVNPSGGGL